MKVGCQRSLRVSVQDESALSIDLRQFASFSSEHNSKLEGPEGVQDRHPWERSSQALAGLLYGQKTSRGRFQQEAAPHASRRLALSSMRPAPGSRIRRQDDKWRAQAAGSAMD